MAKISTYGIDGSPNLGDKLIGTDVHDSNITKNYTLGDIYDLFASQGGGGLGFVPYVGANNDVNLGNYFLTASKIIKAGGTASQFLKADGTVDSNTYVTTGDLSGYVPYIGAVDDVDLGVYILTTPTIVLDTIEPITTSISTEYSGNAVGLGLDFNTGTYFLGDYNSLATPSGISYVIDSTNGYAYTTFVTDPIGLLLDFNNNYYILGDGAEINNGTFIAVSDGVTQTINTLHQGVNKGLGLNFTAEEYYIGDLNKDALIVDTQYDVIYTQHNADLIGLELYFPNREFVLGDPNALYNGTFLKVDDTNQRIEISKALYTSTSTGSVGQILVSQGPASAPQWQNHASVSSYYGSFYDTTTQTLVSGTAGPMKFNTTVLSTGVSIQNDLGGKPTQILIANAGIYNIQFSAQLQRTSGGTAKQVVIWLRKNGVDIPNSATHLTVQANATFLLAAWNFFETFTAGQYAEIMWTQDDAITIAYDPANLVVPYPATPSVILTVNKIG